jgi:hypothetical protein
MMLSVNELKFLYRNRDVLRGIGFLGRARPVVASLTKRCRENHASEVPEPDPPADGGDGLPG